MEFDPEAALQAALDLFWCKGFEATSLLDLLAVMGISRSSFYQAFGSKHRLFERCLEQFRSQQVARMSAALEAAPSAAEFLQGFLLTQADEARTGVPSRGCLIMNTATEFAGRDASVAERVAEGTRAFSVVLERAVRQAQMEGSINPRKDAKALAQYLIALMAGMKAMVKAGADGDALERVAEIALHTLD